MDKEIKELKDKIMSIEKRMNNLFEETEKARKVSFADFEGVDNWDKLCEFLKIALKDYKPADVGKIIIDGTVIEVHTFHEN